MGHVSKYQRNKFCVSVHVGSDLVSSRKVAATTELAVTKAAFQSSFREADG